MMNLKVYLAFCAVFGIIFSSPAGMITLDLDTHLSTAGNSSGSYTKTKEGKGRKGEVLTHNSGIATVSKSDKPKTESRAYFVFDLSQVTTTILEASIEFTGSGDSMNLEFFRVKSDVDDLRNGVGDNKQLKKFYDDLGKDTKYAAGKQTSFDFASALNDLNSARSLGDPLFAFGVKSKDKKSFTFDNLKLTLTTAVPEPGEIFLLLVGVGLIFVLRRKKVSMA